MPEDPVYELRECINCFIVCQTQNSSPFNFLCEYCLKHPEMTSFQYLLRKIDVMDNMYAFRFPDLLKHLVRHLDLKHLPNNDINYEK